MFKMCCEGIAIPFVKQAFPLVLARLIKYKGSKPLYSLVC